MTKDFEKNGEETPKTKNNSLLIWNDIALKKIP